MDITELQEKIEFAWENQRACEPEILEEIFLALDQGRLRVAEKRPSGWTVHQWIKKAILLYFRDSTSQLSLGTQTSFYDKIPLKCAGWTTPDFEKNGFRLTPGAIVRWGTFIGKQAVIMPSFVNTGVYIDEGTMIDTHVRVGSCAQIGKNCHLSDGVGIGGVLEPLQTKPVIIEDNCFIGARSQVIEGVFVGEGSVLGMGVTLGASTKIIHRDTNVISYGSIPPYSVVVPGAVSVPEIPHLSLDCAIIIKQVDAQTREKTGINELLRL